MPNFLANGGEMGALINAHDWRSTPLGAFDTWPNSLKSTLATFLSCPQPIFIAWGPQLLSLFNDAYRPMLGARVDDALGQPFAKVWPEAWADVEPIVKKALKGEGSSHKNMPFTLTRNGYLEQTWWTFSYMPLRDDKGAVAGMFSIMSDVTEQMQAQQLVLAGDQRHAFWTGLNDGLREATEPQLIMTITADQLSRYLQADCASFAQADRAGESLYVDKTCKSSKSPDVSSTLQLSQFGPLLSAALQAGQTVAINDTHADLLAGGPAFNAAYAAIGCRSLLSTPQLKDGRIAAVLYVISSEPRVWTEREITHVKNVAERTWASLQRLQAENALRETNSALDERTTELLRIETALRQSQKLEALGQLTGGVAHDFNNLLAVISSSIELLRNDKLPLNQHGKYLNLIFDTVARAVKLTNQLLAFARQQPLSPEVFNVDVHTQNVLDLVRPLLGSQMEVRHERCTANTCCFAEADISQFEAALVNLLINARDAMNAVGLLTITVQMVDAVPAGLGHGPRPGKFVAISVADKGCGIAPNKLQTVFEPFYTTKEVGKGTGLGLSQVFGFAKQSGGDVDVRSDMGIGSVFTLYLPSAESLPASKAIGVTPNSASVGNGLRLLIVEDNEVLAEMTCEILNTLDYQTTWVASGAAALELLARKTGQFDLVFSDVVMPGINGIEMAKEVRKRYPTLPVVLASGYSTVVDEEGTHGFELIGKPYTSDTLVRLFQNAMSRQNA